MSSSTAWVSTVMKSTGCGSASTTKTKVPVRLQLGGDQRVGDLPGEHLAQVAPRRTAPCSTRMVPSGRGCAPARPARSSSCCSLTSERLSSWLPMTVSVATRVESRVSAMRPCGEVDVDEALGTLDVQGAGAPRPAEHLQDLDDAEGVERALHTARSL